MKLHGAGRKKALTGLLIVFAVTLAVFSNTLQNGFAPEDYELISNNDFIHHWENTRILFNRYHILKPFGIRAAANPLTLLSLMFDYRNFGNSPFGYHLVNLLLHCLNVALVFWLFCLIKAGFRFSIAAALLFSVHPIQAEAANVAGFRADLLAVFFFIGSLIFFIKTVEKKKFFYLPLVLLFYFCAVLSKVSAVTLPLVFALYAFIYHRNKLWPKIAAVLTAGLGLFYGLFYWRQAYGLVISRIFNVIYVNYTGTIRPYSSVFAYLNTILISFLHYVGKLLAPAGLSYDYQVTIPAGLSAGPVFGFTLLLSAVIAAVRCKDRILKFGLGFFLITYLPVSNIIPLFNAVADRYMYLPLAGASLVILRLAEMLVMRVLFYFGGGRQAQKIKAAGVFLLLVVFSGMAFSRNFVFYDMKSLGEDTVKKSPLNPRARLNLAVAYSRNEEWEKSNLQLDKVIELSPLYKRGDVWEMRADNYSQLGKKEDAGRHYLKALALKPSNRLFAKFYETVPEENKAGRLKVLKAWQETIPSSTIACIYLGNYYFGEGRYNKAEYYYEKALSFQ